MIYYIAEIGLAHDGSLGIAHSYIDALSKTGINAIKFQMHLAEYESSEHEKFRVNFSYEDKSRFDYWKRTSFNLEQWIGLKHHCEKLNLDFLVSPFSKQIMLAPSPKTMVFLVLFKSRARHGKSPFSFE